MNKLVSRSGLALLALTAVVLSGCSSTPEAEPTASETTSTAGVLDAAFGVAEDGTPNGIVNTSLGDGNDFARDVAVQADGKLVVVGDHVDGDSTNIVVVRYNEDGSLDESFGVADDGTPNGIVNTSLGEGDDLGRAVAIEADGQIVVAGDHVEGDSTNLALLRYNTDGSLDASFGTANDNTPNGIVNVSLGEGNDIVQDVQVQTDGKILVTGYHQNGDSTDMFVARFNEDGSLDESFGVADDGTPNGIVNTSTGDGDDTARALTIQADGKILVVGTRVAEDGSSNIAVIRYTIEGALDETFGVSDDGTDNGIVNTSLGEGNDVACGIAVAADGSILVAGNHDEADSSNVTVVRYLADGSLDESFGVADDGTPNGVVNTSLGEGNDFACGIAVAADGKIVVSGYHEDGDSTNIVAIRYNTDGSLDQDFGVSDDGTDNGIVNMSLGEGNDIATALALQADGKIVIVGYHEEGTSTNIAVLRLLAA